MKKLNVKVTGMHCKSCETLIKEELEENEGITTVNISYDKEDTVIFFDPDKITEDKIKGIIKGLGYGVR